MRLNFNVKDMNHIIFVVTLVTSALPYYLTENNSLHFLKIDAGSINLQVKNNGYHRILHTIVEADYDISNYKDCAIMIKYNFPTDIYVDTYELKKSMLNQNVEYYVNSKFIDVELPAYKANSFVLHIVNYSHINEKNKLFDVEFPFHLRYQKSMENGQYKEIRFGKNHSDVQLFYICKGPIELNRKYFAPASEEWIFEKSIQINKKAVMSVPVGDLNKLFWVNLLTHLIVLMGTYYVIQCVVSSSLLDRSIISLNLIKK
ncbi:phosphatidylinositol-glycan biosynthesis class X protein-like [Daktulosphaira vitifoliae]|uniref:phosphatidylinositol-glycan biosynthesis class X protein-like n=1 Tax=Daktulosphaira vitifoliae TaxID=58002 RepID=UPI0021A9AA07|nr:phosphatidylinositol-glycan biosynthesis class X protein-like [Daktulosphaira vitifoliae]